MNQTYLIIYSVLLLIVFIFYQKRKKTFDAGSLLLLVFFVGSIFSELIYYKSFNDGSFAFPLIYLFAALMISFAPIMKFRDSIPIVFPRRSLINLLSWIFVVSTIWGMLTSSNNVIDGLRNVLLDESAGLEMYNGMLDSVENQGHTIHNLPMIIMNMMYSFAALLLFVNLTFEKPNKLLVVLIAFSLFYGAIKYISIGERGGLVNRSLVVLISYVCLKSHLSDSINKKIRRIGIIVAVALFVPFMALTISRFGDTYGGSTNSLYNYAGQGTIHFCQYGLDDNGIRYGDRTMSLFKRFLGFPNTPHNFLERRSKYPHLKINDEVFSTYVGDFTIDYGPILAMIIFILYSILMTNMVQRHSNRIMFHSFVLLHFSMCVFVQGVSLFQYADTGNLTILLYILLYFYFKYANVYTEKRKVAYADNSMSI